MKQFNNTFQAFFGHFVRRFMFDLILYVLVCFFFFIYDGKGHPGLKQYLAGINVLLKDTTPVRLEPTTPWSQVEPTALPSCAAFKKA